MRSDTERYSGSDQGQPQRREEDVRARKRAEEEREPPVQIGEDAGAAPAREEPAP